MFRAQNPRRQPGSPSIFGIETWRFEYGAKHQDKDLWGSDDAAFKTPNHDQVLVPDVVPPLDEVVFYRLFVQYLVVAGDGEHLNVEHGGTLHSY